MPPFLPSEILGMIISFIYDIESLLALRQVNKVWHDAVDYILGQILYVDMLNKNLVRLNSVSQTENLRNNVRTLVLNLPDRPVWNCFSDSDPLSRDLVTLPEQETREFNRVQVLVHMIRSRVSQDRNFLFPKLAHLAIQFRPPPILKTKYLCSPATRGYHLKDIFSDTVMSFHGYHGLNELSILNMPIEFSLPFWISPSTILNWQQVGKVMREFRLKTLRMSFLGPKIWPYQNGDRARAPSARANHLLACTVKETLRHLSLSYWGFYMKNSPGYGVGELHLPHLQSLELRSCGFTSSQSLVWILSHSDTLRSLKFDDCAIVYSMELAPGSKGEFGSQSIDVGIVGGRVYQLYRLVWADWFQQLANGLPHLQRFDFGSSRIRAPGEIGPRFESETLEGPRFGHTNEFLFGIFPDRYLEMKDGAGETPWVLRMVPSQRRFKEPPDVDQPDISALRQLFAITGQVVRESDISSHAAQVVDLIGSVKRY